MTAPTLTDVVISVIIAKLEEESLASPLSQIASVPQVAGLVFPSVPEDALVRYTLSEAMVLFYEPRILICWSWGTPFLPIPASKSHL